MTPALIATLVQYAVQFGIPAVMDVIAILKNNNATIADVEIMFSKVKTYESYGIPTVVPTIISTTTSTPPTLS